MKLTHALKQIRATAPIGVVIVTDPDALPSLAGNPDWKTPLHHLPHSDVQFVLLAQPTTNNADLILSVPDVLGINGETQIGLSRAKRILPASQTTIAPVVNGEECSICGSAPKTRTKALRKAFSMDNGRPFGPLLHNVVSTTKHIVSLSDVGIDELHDSIEQFLEIAQQGRSTLGNALDGLTIGMNFGDYARAGASQIHFHYQVSGLGKANYNAGDRLGALCKASRQQRNGRDYLGDYVRALRQAELVVAENKLAISYAPVSPRFKGEVQIMVNRSQAGNIMDTTEEERLAIAQLQYDAMQRFFRLGCTALNQVWYTTRFSTVNDFGQRLIISLCPRTSILAFYELSGNNVIDNLPWKSAETLRAAAAIHFRL